MTRPPGLLCGIDIGSDRVRTVLARVPASSFDTEGPPQLEVLAVGQAESRNSVQHGEVVRQAGVTEAVRHTGSISDLLTNTHRALVCDFSMYPSPLPRIACSLALQASEVIGKSQGLAPVSIP